MLDSEKSQKPPLVASFPLSIDFPYKALYGVTIGRKKEEKNKKNKNFQAFFSGSKTHFYGKCYKIKCVYYILIYNILHF